MKNYKTLLACIIAATAIASISGCNTQTSDNIPVTDITTEADTNTSNAEIPAFTTTVEETTTEEITETTDEIDEIEEISDFTDDDFVYYEVLSDDNELEGYGISGWDENKELPANLTIPAEHDGKPVVQITASFKGNRTVKNVILPDTITEINAPIFYYCNSIETVTLPKDLSYLCDDLFYGCSNLKSVVIPDNVVEINYETFCNCESLTHIDLPDSIEKIGESAFYGCESLGEITIPDTVIELDPDAFGAHDMELTVNYNGKQYEWYDLHYGRALHYE